MGGEVRDAIKDEKGNLGSCWRCRRRLWNCRIGDRPAQIFVYHVTASIGRCYVEGIRDSRGDGPWQCEPEQDATHATIVGRSSKY
mmetsp:Transcript_30478/g.45100  ORF Transcript_30478/g.45100 Transcript_30478/m.45100 type:complete len:85 (-) Transcript_30478:485-739(-)